MEMPSIESQGNQIALEKQVQPPHNLQKRKRSPSNDQKKNEKLPSKIPRREICLPILPHESKINNLYFS